MLGGHDHLARGRGGGAGLLLAGQGAPARTHSDKHVDVLRLELRLALRHLRRARLLVDRLNQQALCRIAGDDRGTGLAALEQGFARVESQTALLIVGVTVVAVGGEDRSNASFEEVRGLRGGGERRGL